ncbi:acyltransferase [Labedella endophytica]|uniref:Acyltransferase n=2 Tax=Labedella endophytica TaxID=1523160 RepID=A0A433JSS1_9MICO|nr:acyltransferase [Labedella endophytica]
MEVEIVRFQRDASKRNLTRDLIMALASARLMPHRYRALLVSQAGVRVGEGVLFMGGIDIVGNAEVTFGRGVFVNHRCYFDAAAPITVGDNVQIGDNVRIITSTHEMGGPERRASKSLSLAVTIATGVWIGSGATVLPGLSVGQGCMIAAGSVVTRDCEDNGLYAGVPARRIREL